MDIVAPREILGWLASDDAFQKEAIIKYVGKKEGSFTTNNGVKITVESTFSNAVQQPNLIWVPGGCRKTLTAIITNQNLLYTAYVKNVRRES
jgi:hypothetical protein